MFPHHNQFMARAPPPPRFPAGPPAAAGVVGGINPNPMSTGIIDIDWGQLAQQWIHMRDSSAPPSSVTPGSLIPPAVANFNLMPLAPPPPIIGNAPEYQRQAPLTTPTPHYEEHGEADMDMDDDTERAQGSDIEAPAAPVVTQSQWTEVSPAPAAATHNAAAAVSVKQPWNNWQAQSQKPVKSNPTAHIPSLLKLNVSNPNEASHQPPQKQQTPQNPLQTQPGAQEGSAVGNEIDANKRKMLPAWIREGLEKMEREKQRQLERQQPLTPTSIHLLDADHLPVNNVKQVSSKTLTTPVNLLNIAMVASDSEDSNAEPLLCAPEAAAAAAAAHLIGNDVLSKRRHSRSQSHSDLEDQPQGQDTTRKDPKQDEEDVASSKETQFNGKNYEERLADLMLVVRRTLTEILLETTNEEIAAIAHETMKAHRAKASSAQVIRKSALSSITGNLGLAAYGDSSSESEEDDDDEESEHNNDSAETEKSMQLSAEELKARIRRSKRAFEKVIDDIEERVAQQEQRDELTLQQQRQLELVRSTEANKLRDSSEQNRFLANPEPPAQMSKNSASDKLSQFNGKRPSRKERTTRFSDNKDGKQAPAPSYVQQVMAPVAVQTSAPSPGLNPLPSKLKPVPNLATNLLQMPESVATMLSAADKALQKAHKTSKSKRRHSSTSSSSSSSSNSSSRSSSSSGSSDSGETNTSSGNSKSSSSRSNSRKNKKRSRSRHRTSGSRKNSSSRHQRDRGQDRDKYERRVRDREREHRYNSSSSGHQRRRDSSHSGEEDGYRPRSSRHSSSRSHNSSSHDYGRQRQRSRSRSKPRSHSRHHHQHSSSYSSSSSASHQRKRH